MMNYDLFRSGIKALLCLYAFFAVFLFKDSAALSLEGAREVERRIAEEKRQEQEKEHALIAHFYTEGERLLAEGNYEDAVEQFSRILEIDPKHEGAKKGLKKINQRMGKKKLFQSPREMAKRLLRSGRLKYGKRDYDGAIKDFQDALVLDYTNDEIIEWLKRARHRQTLTDTGNMKKEVLRDTVSATKKKDLRELKAMLEIEEAYQPPKKRERRPLEIEEIISSDQQREEEARRKLLEKLREKMVPAVSLTEADIRDVIRQLMEITGVTIVIDEAALAQSTGEEPLRLTFSTVTPVPLLEVLDIALRPTDLGYRIEPNYIWISTPERLEKENLVTRTYQLKHGIRRVRKVELREFESKTGEAD